VTVLHQGNGCGGKTALTLINKRDAIRKLGPYWERNVIEHDCALSADFVMMMLDMKLSCSTAFEGSEHHSLIIESNNFAPLRWFPAPAREWLSEREYGLRQRRAQRSSDRMSSVAMVFGCLALILAIFYLLGRR